MVHKDAKGNRTGPNMVVRSKIDKGAGEMSNQFLFLGNCVQQGLTPLRKALEKFDSVWTTLIAY